MKKITLSLIVLLFFSVNSFAKKEPYIGEILYGNIGPFGLGTEILLPEGEWVVAGVTVSNGSVRWAELVLLQIESDKIKALLNIKYPRKLEERIGKSSGGDHKEGWRRDKHFDNNTCDDYDRQDSNYHETLIKKRIGGQRIIVATCISIFASNRFDKSTNFQSQAWRMAQDYVERVNLNYPNVLLNIDNTYFSLENVVHTYYSINPGINGIKSRDGGSRSNSAWDKYNISKHEDKNKFMSNAIFIGQNVLRQNDRSFSNHKRLDLREYQNLFQD